MLFRVPIPDARQEVFGLHVAICAVSPAGQGGGREPEVAEEADGLVGLVPQEALLRRLDVVSHG
jgi:hypothetical protein